MTRTDGQSDVVRLCKDCRWHAETAGFDESHDRCSAPQNFKPEASVVRGHTKRLWAFCESARSFDCGKSAKWFAPRNDAELNGGVPDEVVTP